MAREILKNCSRNLINLSAQLAPIEDDGPQIMGVRGLLGVLGASPINLSYMASLKIISFNFLTLQSF